MSTQTGDDHVHLDIPVVDDSGSAGIDSAVGADQVWITVAAAAGVVDDGTLYDYTLTVSAQDDTGPFETDDTGDRHRICSCGGGSSASWPGVMLAFALWRKKR